MVVAISSTSRTPKNPSTPKRTPLTSSEKNNSNAGTISRKPRSKDIASHLLPSSSIQPNTPSPLLQPPLLSRSQSTTSRRSLSVSFQTDSLSLQTTKPTRPKNTPQPLNSNSLARTRFNCAEEQRGQVPATVRVVRRSSFDGDINLYLINNSDTDSNNSVSGSREHNSTCSLKGRGISVPARFWPCSPNKAGDLPLKRMGSGLKGQPSIVPSILSFTNEARRAKREESRIEEVHSLRLLYNRYLQWRYVNAQSEAALKALRMNVEQNLYNEWMTTSELRESVRNKRIKLQLALQNFKLISILKGQITYLEEWSLVDKEHYNHLEGLFQALRASTIRLPVIGRARVDIKELQGALVSAVDVIQAMETSICSLLSKVEGTNALVSELAKAAAYERALLEQSKDLLSEVAVLHVKQCCLQGHIIHLNRRLEPTRV